MRLYNNPGKGERECGKCHQIKSYPNFKNRSDNPLIKRSICKECEIKMESDRLQMKSWINKINAIRYVTNNQNKCQICNEIYIENLPMFDFHHPKPEKSSSQAKEKGFWRSVRYKAWSYIKRELYNQGVIAVCRNCHAKINASFFNDYRDIIKCIDNPNKITPQIIGEKYIRNELKTFIRKKLIILDVCDGKCINCGFGIDKQNIENLPALELHHKDLNLKSFRNFHKLCFSTSNISKLKNILINNKCVCLCSNCHILEQSNFFNDHKEKIISEYEKRHNCSIQRDEKFFSN